MVYASQEEGDHPLDIPDQYAEHFDSQSSKRNNSLGRLDKLAGEDAKIMIAFRSAKASNQASHSCIN